MKEEYKIVTSDIKLDEAAFMDCSVKIDFDDSSRAMLTLTDEGELIIRDDVTPKDVALMLAENYSQLHNELKQKLKAAEAILATISPNREVVKQKLEKTK